MTNNKIATIIVIKLDSNIGPFIFFKKDISFIFFLNVSPQDIATTKVNDKVIC